MDPPRGPVSTPIWTRIVAGEVELMWLRTLRRLTQEQPAHEARLLPLLQAAATRTGEHMSSYSELEARGVDIEPLKARLRLAVRNFEQHCELTQIVAAVASPQRGCEASIAARVAFRVAFPEEETARAVGRDAGLSLRRELARITCAHLFAHERFAFA